MASVLIETLLIRLGNKIRNNYHSGKAFKAARPVSSIVNVIKQDRSLNNHSRDFCQYRLSNKTWYEERIIITKSLICCCPVEANTARMIMIIDHLFMCAELSNTVLYHIAYHQSFPDLVIVNTDCICNFWGLKLVPNNVFPNFPLDSALLIYELSNKREIYIEQTGFVLM